MLDKGHCKMLHEGEALFEYADFYDYRLVVSLFPNVKRALKYYDNVLRVTYDMLESFSL